MGMVHATCVGIMGTGVLLRGPSGCGKSDVALRLIDAGAVLVADDQVDLRNEDGRVVARPAGPLKGLMEVRGLGILPFDHLAECPVGLVVDLETAEAVERMPVPRSARLVDADVPLITLHPFECSLVAKIKLAVAGAREGRLGVPMEAA